MSAIVRIECYKENLRFSFNLSLKGGSRSPSTSLIFLYGLTSFFFKQRFIMCRIAQLAPHDFTKILPKYYQNITKILPKFYQNFTKFSNFEYHKSHCTSLTETLHHPHIQTITLRGTKVPLWPLLFNQFSFYLFLFYFTYNNQSNIYKLKTFLLLFIFVVFKTSKKNHRTNGPDTTTARIGKNIARQRRWTHVCCCNCRHHHWTRRR